MVALWLAAPQESGALRARLTLQDARPALGQPVRLRLELINEGRERIIYQAAHLPFSDVLEVWRPDGRPAPHVYGSHQTGDQDLPLDPGRTAVLLDGFDLAEHYHLPESGRYRVRFRGDTLELANRVPAPTSNVLEIELGPGRRSPATEVVERLLPVLPKGWELARSVRPGKIEVWLTGLVRSKQDQARVELSLADRQPARRDRAWGRTRWGLLWVMVSPKAREAWPAHRRDIIGALGVQP